MAKAALRLGMTQPAVSDIVAGLNKCLVYVFDRNPRGVEPTIYGRAILKRGRAAFDELRQGIRDIDFLADPAAGEIKIGCPASVLGGTLSLAVEHFSKRYPRVVLHFDEVTSPGSDFPSLRERKHDLILARIARPLVDEEDFNIEILFQDPLLITADAQSKWARRRRIDPKELIGATWILTAPDTMVYRSMAEAFHARGLSMPKISIVALSGHLRMFLVSRGPFVTALPSSLLRFNAVKLSLKVLPVDLRIADLDAEESRAESADRTLLRTGSLDRGIEHCVSAMKEGPLGVETGSAQSEHNESGLPLIADWLHRQPDVPRPRKLWHSRARLAAITGG